MSKKDEKTNTIEAAVQSRRQIPVIDFTGATCGCYAEISRDGHMITIMRVCSSHVSLLDPRTPPSVGYQIKAAPAKKHPECSHGPGTPIAGVICGLCGERVKGGMVFE